MRSFNPLAQVGCVTNIPLTCWRHHGAHRGGTFHQGVARNAFERHGPVSHSPGLDPKSVWRLKFTLIRHHMWLRQQLSGKNFVTFFQFALVCGILREFAPVWRRFAPALFPLKLRISHFALQISKICKNQKPSPNGVLSQDSPGHCMSCALAPAQSPGRTTRALALYLTGLSF